MSLIQEFKSAIENSVKKANSDILYLSGGVDSATILAACLNLGMSPKCFTFQLGEYKSPDVIRASEMCRYFSLEHHIVKIPQTEDVLVNDIRRMISGGCSVVKTHLQCLQPFMYLNQGVLDRFGPSRVMIGMDADDLWGSGRKGAVAYHNGGDIYFREHRKHEIEAPPSSSSTISITKYSKTQGITLIDIFRDNSVIEMMLCLNYNQMHKPHFKQLALSAYPDFWNSGKWYRKQDALQIISGIREWHDTLLNSKYNINNRKAVIGIYNDIASGLV